MPYPPTKDEIVARVAGAITSKICDTYSDEARQALDALIVPDLLSLLRERGAEIAEWPFGTTLDGRPEYHIRCPEPARDGWHKATPDE